MGIQSKDYHLRWRRINRSKWNDYSRRYYEKAKERIRLKRQSPEYRKRMGEYLKKWRANNVHKRKLAMKEWTDSHRDYLVRYRKDYADRRRELYKANRERICARKRELGPKYRKRINAYQKARRKQSVEYSLKDSLRASMNRAFRRNWIRKPYRTEALLGCSITEAKAHIEKQFVDGMSWENRRSFVIDHWVPIIAFDLTDEEEVVWAFNWMNLRPLTPYENHVKSDTLPNPLPSFLPSHIAARILSRAKDNQSK